MASWTRQKCQEKKEGYFSRVQHYILLHFGYCGFFNVEFLSVLQSLIVFVFVRTTHSPKRQMYDMVAEDAPVQQEESNTRTKIQIKTATQFETLKTQSDKQCLNDKKQKIRKITQFPTPLPTFLVSKYGRITEMQNAFVDSDLFLSASASHEWNE